MIRAWSSCALPAGRMPGVTSLNRGPERRAQRRRFAAPSRRRRRGRSRPSAARAAAPAAPASPSIPVSRRSASARLVSTVTAISSGFGAPPLRRGARRPRRAPPRASRAPPAACTFSIQTPSRVAAAQACATVFGMSWNLRSRKTRKPRATIQRTGSGPGDDEHLLADLERAGRGIEAVGERQRVHRIGEVERDDDARIGSRSWRRRLAQA